MKDELDSKKRILDSAKILFAHKGFKGTSIRDIAKAANVNVSAINYYFQNKENLFQELIRNSYHEINLSLDVIFNKNLKQNMEEFCLQVFDHLLSNQVQFFNTFKIYFSEDDFLVSNALKDIFQGPPGINYFIKVWENQVERSFNPQVDRWKLLAILSCLFHGVLVLHSPMTKIDTGERHYQIEKDDYRFTLQNLISLMTKKE
ncbi:MAG: TetR family transcriptional regulator [Bacteriovoracia bacterium]